MTQLNNFAPYAAGGIAAVIALLALRRGRRGLPLPPGPKPLPLVGNLFDIPKERAWLAYREMNDRYGDVVHLDVLGQKIIVLGSATAASDLLDVRGAVYSDRPTSPMMDLIGAEWSLVAIPYGETWKRKRKLMHAHVHQGVVHRYYPVQLAAARRLARAILEIQTGRENLQQAVRLNFGQTVIKVVYGIDVESADSEYMTLPEKVLEYGNAVINPGAFLVDVLPFLKYLPSWFPGAGFQRFAAAARATQKLALDRPISVVQAQMADGTAQPSMARTMLEEDENISLDESQLDAIKGITGVSYIAGSDTTQAAVVSFVLAMLTYPEVQAKAQTEVDRVVGMDRLPDSEDLRAMPYIRGVANECLRWLPVVPLAIPHCATRNDEYKGYFIPKGSLVLGPIWNILHNAEDYPEPERFNPERYLTPDGQLDPTVRDPATACFGFGRRICPGRFFADAGLFMTIATLLATVDIVKARDAEDNEIEPEVAVKPSFLAAPEPFPWAVRPRRQLAKDMLEVTEEE